MAPPRPSQALVLISIVDPSQWATKIRFEARSMSSPGFSVSLQDKGIVCPCPGAVNDSTWSAKTLLDRSDEDGVSADGLTD